MGEGQSKADLLAFLPPDVRRDLPLACHSVSDDEGTQSDDSECPSAWSARKASHRKLADVDNRLSDTLIVFDWDDTLLCTSAINAHSWTDLQLHQLERIGEDILRSSMQLGETIIITNGIESWVQNSAGRYLPGLLPTLNSMTVLSARAMYEDRAPGDPFAWKKHAFRELLAERQDRVGFHENRLNLVVIGDSQAEIDAAKYATKLCGGHSPLLKTIKFKDCPTVHDLLGQLRRLAQELDHIVQETATAHRGMAQRDLPEHLDHLGNWASGWRCVERKQEKPRPLGSPLSAFFVA
jgi:hypothetical protein